MIKVPIIVLEDELLDCKAIFENFPEKRRTTHELYFVIKEKDSKKIALSNEMPTNTNCEIVLFEDAENINFLDGDKDAIFREIVSKKNFVLILDLVLVDRETQETALSESLLLSLKDADVEYMKRIALFSSFSASSLEAESIAEDNYIVSLSKGLSAADTVEDFYLEFFKRLEMV